jgi:hypothetical protein
LPLAIKDAVGLVGRIILWSTKRARPNTASPAMRNGAA